MENHFRKRSSTLTLFLCFLHPLQSSLSYTHRNSVGDGYSLRECVHMKPGDSHIPEAIGWLWWETGPLLRKQSKTTLPAWWEKMQREKARAAFYHISETKHRPWRRTWEEWEPKQQGWQRKSPFPLSCASTSCARRKSLVGYAVISFWLVRGFHPGEWFYFEPAAMKGMRRSEAHAHTSQSWLLLWKTHPHTTGPTGNSTARYKQALPVCAGGPFTETPIKIQCSVYWIIIAIIQETLPLIC